MNKHLKIIVDKIVESVQKALPGEADNQLWLTYDEKNKTPIFNTEKPYLLEDQKNSQCVRLDELRKSIWEHIDGERACAIFWSNYNGKYKNINRTLFKLSPDLSDQQISTIFSLVYGECNKNYSLIDGLDHIIKLEKEQGDGKFPRLSMALALEFFKHNVEPEQSGMGINSAYINTLLDRCIKIKTKIPSKHYSVIQKKIHSLDKSTKENTNFIEIFSNFIKQVIEPHYWEEFICHLPDKGYVVKDDNTIYEKHKKLENLSPCKPLFEPKAKGVVCVDLNLDTLLSFHPLFTFTKEAEKIIQYSKDYINNRKEDYGVWNVNAVTDTHASVMSLIFQSKDEKTPDKEKILNTLTAYVELYCEMLNHGKDLAFVEQNMEAVLLKNSMEKQLETPSATTVVPQRKKI